MSGAHTLRQTEQATDEKLGGLPLDMDAMTAVSNLYRAASAIRNHFEQSVLKQADLTWTAFVVLWVVWIWRSMETRHVAAEAGITKGTLTGVAQTLEARGLLVREIHPEDRRRTLLSLTDDGEKLMTELFPAFNREEQFVVAGLAQRRVKDLGTTLRRILSHLEEAGPQRQAEIEEEAGPAAALPARRARSTGRSSTKATAAGGRTAGGRATSAARPRPR